MVDSCQLGGVTFSCKDLGHGMEACIGEEVAGFPLEPSHGVIVGDACFSGLDGSIT